MTRLLLSSALLFVAMSSSAHALTRTWTAEDYEIIEIDFSDGADTTSDTHGDTTSNGAGSCQRGCTSDYQACIADADAGAQNTCGSAYQDLLAGLIDRSMYELIMDTCYGGYDADSAVCTESYGMCQEGCQAP